MWGVCACIHTEEAIVICIRRLARIMLTINEDLLQA